jgi:hypothetical protein
MTAFQARNFEDWITSLDIAFSKNFPEIYFLIEKKKFQLKITQLHPKVEWLLGHFNIHQVTE